MSFRYETVEEFAAQTERLVAEHPARVRVVAKYSNSKGELTLRGTDDVVSLQCSSDRHADLAAADRVLTITMAQMCGLTPEQLQRQQDKLAGVSQKKRSKKRK